MGILVCRHGHKHTHTDTHPPTYLKKKKVHALTAAHVKNTREF